MKHTPLVTIGIPTHNRASDLASAIEQLRTQSYSNIEIIVADNCSTDETSKVLRKLTKKDSRVHFFRHKTLVPAIANFNSLLEKATGEYFMWASDDDAWDKKYVETIMDVFLKEGERTLLVTTAFRVMDQTKRLRDEFHWSFEYYRKKYLSFADYLFEGFNGYKADLFYGIYRTDLLREIGGYQHQSVLAASDLMTLHTILCVGMVRFIPKALFVKQEFFIDATPGYTPKKGLRLLYATLYPWKYILSNILLPWRLLYILRQTLPYYTFNFRLIHSYCRDSWRLHWLNVRSTMQLLSSNLPNEFTRLKHRTEVFSG